MSATSYDASSVGSSLLLIHVAGPVDAVEIVDAADAAQVGLPSNDDIVVKII